MKYSPFTLLILMGLSMIIPTSAEAETLQDNFNEYSPIDRYVPQPGERWGSTFGNPWEISSTGRSGNALKGKHLDETGAARPGEIYFKLAETISAPKSIKLWIHIDGVPESEGQPNPTLMIQLVGKPNLGGVPKIGGSVNIGVESMGHIRETWAFDLLVNSPKSDSEPKGVSQKRPKQVSAETWTPVEMEFSPDGTQFRARVGADEPWLEWQPFRLAWEEVENVRFMRRGLTVMIDDLIVEY